MATPNSPTGLRRSASERGWNSSVKSFLSSNKASPPPPPNPVKPRAKEESIDVQAVLASELNFLGLNSESQQNKPVTVASAPAALPPDPPESVLSIPIESADDPDSSPEGSSPSAAEAPSTPSFSEPLTPSTPSFSTEQLGRSTSNLSAGPLDLDAKANEQRIRIVNELLSTEDTYVNSLQILFNDYYKPMRAASMLYGVTRPQVATIFSCFEALMNFHQSFLTALRTETEVAQSGNLSSVWTLFLKQVDYLKMYSTYMTNYPKAAQAISQLKDQPKFQGLLTRNREKRGLDLMSYLIMPVQRIPRYELLLREVIKNTPNQHPEYPTLSTLFAKVQQIAGSINEGQRQMENMSKLLEIQNRLTGGFQLLTPGRSLIRDGPLSKYASGFLGTQSTHTRLFFLFNDKLLWATPKYEYRGHVELAGAAIAEIDPGAFKAERAKSPQPKPSQELEPPASPPKPGSRSRSPASNSRRFMTLGKDFKVSQALDVPTSPLTRQATEGSPSERSPSKSRLSRLSLSSASLPSVPSIKVEGPIWIKGGSDVSETEKFIMFTAASPAEHEAWKNDLENAIRSYRLALATNKDRRTSLGVPVTQLGDDRKIMGRGSVNSTNSRDSASISDAEQAASAAGVSPQLIEATRRLNKATTATLQLPSPNSSPGPSPPRKLSL